MDTICNVLLFNFYILVIVCLICIIILLTSGLDKNKVLVFFTLIYALVLIISVVRYKNIKKDSTFFEFIGYKSNNIKSGSGMLDGFGISNMINNVYKYLIGGDKLKTETIVDLSEKEDVISLVGDEKMVVLDDDDDDISMLYNFEQSNMLKNIIIPKVSTRISNKFDKFIDNSKKI